MLSSGSERSYTESSLPELDDSTSVSIVLSCKSLRTSSLVYLALLERTGVDAITDQNCHDVLANCAHA